MLSAELHKENREATAAESYGRFLDNRFRTYDPSIGRYISADPIGQFGGLALDGVVPELRLQPRLPGSIPFVPGALEANLYQYALGNPLAYADPLGLWSVTVTAFNGGWGGVGESVTIGADDSGGFFDATAGVGVGAGFSFDPNGTAPVSAACGTPASAWVGFGGALGAQAGPFSAGASGFWGGALGGNPPSFNYAPQTSPQFGVGSVGLGLYGVGGVRIGASGL